MEIACGVLWMLDRGAGSGVGLVEAWGWFMRGLVEVRGWLRGWLRCWLVEVWGWLRRGLVEV